MKLIHSGKVLKDDDKIDSCNIKPNDFLVVMIAKVRQIDMIEKVVVIIKTLQENAFICTGIVLLSIVANDLSCVHFQFNS